MKTLIRILLVCFCLLFIALVAGYFVVTSAGFQKSMLEGQLPAGSSIGHVHVTQGSLQLSELILVLEDGTKVKVADVDTSFSLKAALFDQTIQMGALEVDGLLVELPAEQKASTASTSESGAHASVDQPEPNVATGPQEVTEAGNPWQVVNAISNLDWLIDIESIQLNGRLKDASGSAYAFDLKSGTIRPSIETVVDASMSLVSSEPLENGLKEFNSKASLRFTQKASGGFEGVQFVSNSSAKDQQGVGVLSVSNTVNLQFDGFKETASVEIEFDASIPRPGLFVPELETMGALDVKGAAAANVDGSVVMLTKADAVLVANGARVLSLDLKKALNLGGKQDLSGELLNLEIAGLPLAWLAPWLPEGIFIEGAPLDAKFSVEGHANGAMEVRALAPVRIGPISVIDGQQPLLQEVSLIIDPVLRVDADQSIQYQLNGLQLLDRYGEVISGDLSGRSEVVESSSNPFAGQTAEVTLKIGMQELFQLPVLKDKASILGGTLNLALKVDGQSQFPVIAEGELRGLRPRSDPGRIKDFSFVAQLQERGADIWGLKLDFKAGHVERYTTDFLLSGQANLVEVPLQFAIDINGPQISQTDVELLTAAFSPNESTSVSPVSRPVERPSDQRTVTHPKATGPVEVAAPPWADLRGEASIQFGKVVLSSGQFISDVAVKAVVSEPLLEVSELKARLGEGTVGGAMEVRFDKQLADAYRVGLDFGFDGVDPSYFSTKRSGSFPVQGLFDGELELTGAGASLDAAVDNSTSRLIITGRDGVMTAFELDNRSQLGLGLAGLLGQQLDRPGITAIAQTVPYFKDMPFDHFVLELSRGDDRKMMIPQVRFSGQSLLVDGSGVIAASSFDDVLDQPLDLVLELGAKGRLTEYLETLQLLEPTVSEDGFRRWNEQVKLGGTLRKPDTDGIMDLLNRAARSALSKPKKDKKEQAQPVVDSSTAASDTASTSSEADKSTKKKSKEEKLRDDVEMSIDLINTFLGN